MLDAPDPAALFTPQARLQAMLAFEAALARAEAKAGVIPEAAAEAITAACQGARFDGAGFDGAGFDGARFDARAIEQAGRHAGNPAIPMVAALTTAVGGEAAGYVHWGATSQDAIDTALMLQARAGLTLILGSLHRLGAGAAGLAARHRTTPMAARTLLQQAGPMPFGLKAAQWLAATTQQIERLDALRATGLALQFGGAFGSLAALGARGMAVAGLLAGELALPLPDVPWHTERSRIAALVAALAIAAGVAGKIAGDVVLLMQSEVGEARERMSPDRGGSSTLPHKRNPVATVYARAAALGAAAQAQIAIATMAQEHERAAGAWHAEWLAVPAAFSLAGEAIAQTAEAIEGLEIDADRMRANLDASRGLVMAEAVSMALAGALGRADAKALVARACREARAKGSPLRAVLAAMPEITRHLGAEALDEALDPARYFGASDELITRALARFRALPSDM